MDEKDKRIEELRREVARWKNRAVDAAAIACENCEEYRPRMPGECGNCRVLKIKEEAGRV